MSLASGTAFGPYRILDPLGRGGMATVYKAYEAGLDRYVALKILPSEFLHDEGFAERFRREAKVIARLEHPNIIPIHNFGIEEQSRTPWMAMRLISGGALSGIMKKGRLGADRTIEILRGVARPSTTRTARASSTATSSPRTSSSTRPSVCTSPTSASRRWSKARPASPRRA